MAGVASSPKRWAYVEFIDAGIILTLHVIGMLTAYVPFLQNWSDASPTSFAIISGVLPPAVSAAFGFFLPIIMRKLTKFMGACLGHSFLTKSIQCLTWLSNRQ